jgi:hypothetical protein
MENTQLYTMVEVKYELKLDDRYTLKMYQYKNTIIFDRNEVCDILGRPDYYAFTGILKNDEKRMFKIITKYTNNKVGDKTYLSICGLLRLLYKVSKPNPQIQYYIDAIIDHICDNYSSKIMDAK